MTQKKTTIIYGGLPNDWNGMLHIRGVRFQEPGEDGLARAVQVPAVQMFDEDVTYSVYATSAAGGSTVIADFADCVSAVAFRDLLKRAQEFPRKEEKC